MSLTKILLQNKMNNLQYLNLGENILNGQSIKILVKSDLISLKKLSLSIWYM